MITILKLPASRWKEYRKLRLESLQIEPIAFSSAHAEERKFSEAEWKRRIKNCLFALDDDTIIGVIVYVFLKQKQIKHIANIYGFYVIPKYRKRGIGKLLLEYALEQIRNNKDIIKIDLNVNPKQKAALNLYKKYGFKKVGILKKDIHVDGKFYDEYVMEKFVR